MGSIALIFELDLHLPAYNGDNWTHIYTHSDKKQKKMLLVYQKISKNFVSGNMFFLVLWHRKFVNQKKKSLGLSLLLVGEFYVLFCKTNFCSVSGFW